MTTNNVPLIASRIRSLFLLFPIVCLLGCSANYTPPPLVGNWQIQSGTTITSPPTVPYLVGALQGSNSAFTGTFNLQQSGSGVTSQIISLTGTYNPSTGNLVLGPPPPQVGGVAVFLSVPADPADVATGSIDFLCGVCNAIPPPIPAVGVEIAPLNGTYTGTLTGTITTSSQTTSISGTASVTFIQSATPNSSGQFPLTAAVTFPSSSGIGTTTLPGLVSGITIEPVPSPAYSRLAMSPAI